MYSNSVLEELWRLKDVNGRKYGGDIRAMADALRDEQIKGGRTVVSFDSSTEQPSLKCLFGAVANPGKGAPD